MAVHNTSPSTSNLLRFPEWQRQFRTALMELDHSKLLKRVTEAEHAIFHRLQWLAKTTNCQSELLAIEDALASLRLLKREQVDFPDWK